jgi:hypothetical protein
LFSEYPDSSSHFEGKPDPVFRREDAGGRGLCLNSVILTVWPALPTVPLLVQVSSFLIMIAVATEDRAESILGDRCHSQFLI